MTPLEERLVAHLAARADEVEVHSDLEAVLDGRRCAVGPTTSDRRHGAVIAAVAAAMLLVAALVGTAIVLLRRDTAGVQDQPPQGASNGVVLTMTGDVVRQVDPSGRGRVVRLPRIAGAKQPPVWAPDGERLAWWDGTKVLTGDTRTGAVTEVTTCVGLRSCVLAWSHHGTQLAVADDHGIAVVDPRRPGVAPIRIAPLDGTATTLSWTPDDRQIVFAEQTAQQVSVRSTHVGDGTTTTLLEPTPGATWMDHWSATLSPDGTTLAWLQGASSTPGHSQAIDLVVMALADRVPRRVATIGSCFCLGLSAELAWSPDGHEIAFVSATIDLAAPLDEQSPGGTFDLYTAHADGTAIRRLLTEVAGTPSWQPIAPTSG